MNIKQHGISIIVCCYNSASRLPKTLECIAAQEIPNIEVCEVVLVNNSSTDNTSEVAIKEWDKYKTKINLKIVEEKEPGLIFARIKGVKESNYEIIIFCDDDNWLQKDYLSRAWQIMNSNSTIGALGGLGSAESEVDFPDWFLANQGLYACGKQWEYSGICSNRMHLFGAGLVSRRSILIKTFDSRFPFKLIGRKGENFYAGDDGELCMRILLLGFELFFDDKLNYKHYVPSYRLSEKYRLEIANGLKYSKKIMLLYAFVYAKINHSNVSLFLMLIRDIFLSIGGKFNIVRVRKYFKINILKLIYFTIFDSRETRKIYRNILLFSNTMLNENEIAV